MGKVEKLLELMEGNSYSIEDACKALNMRYGVLNRGQIEEIESQLVICEYCLSYVKDYDLYSDGCDVCKNNTYLVQ